MQTDAIAGAVLGCAVGDAIGLPYERLSKRRGVRLLGQPDRHRFLFGRGMVSDDTEHTCMVAEALCAAPADPDAFAIALARRMRWWLLGFPVGLGSATLRATLKLWLGIPPGRSGVFSAGNGPAMRSAILGAALDDVESLKRFVLASTRITHVDPKAYDGALVVALAAWCARRGIHAADGFLAQFRAASPDAPDELAALMGQVEASIGAGDSTEAFAQKLGCGRGVSGYVYRTVPVALHAWLCHPLDLRSAVIDAVRCGGDADTTAAIAGAIVGSGGGRSAIPAEWLAGLWEWPRTVGWMERLASATEQAIRQAAPVAPPRATPLVGLVRNAIFFAVVLGHVARRLLPPY
jgi:ADP-ribosyl-[dinitrogen reductase] hydrolase